MATIKLTKNVGGLEYTIDSGTPFRIENEKITTTADDSTGILNIAWGGRNHPFIVANHTFMFGTNAVTGTASAIKARIDGFINGSTVASIANNTEAFVAEAYSSDAARGKMAMAFASPVINAVVDPMASVGYNQDFNGVEIVAGEKGLVLRIEGNYNDGTANRKMEIYFQYAFLGGYKRPIFIQMDKATNLCSAWFATSDLIKFFAEGDIASYSFAKNIFYIHPAFTNASTKIQMQAASGQVSIVSQGYSGADDMWLQYHDTTDQFGMWLNGRRIGTWYSKLSGAGTAGAGLSIGGTPSNQAILTANTGTSHSSLRTIVAVVSSAQTGNAFETQDSSLVMTFAINPKGQHIFPTSTTPADPVSGSSVEWFDGTNKKWKKNVGGTVTTGNVY